MAILATVNFSRPPFPDAPLRCYVRVVRIAATKEITVASVEILSLDQRTLLETRSITLRSSAPPGGVHHIEQAYDHLKGHAEFQDVEDC